MFTRKFYLKLLMSLLLTALAVPQGKAETLLVGNGTSTTYYVPVHSTYLDAVGSAYQVIYPASDLENMTGCEITGLTFHASSDINFTGGSVQVSVGETSSATFSSATAITNLDVVATKTVEISTSSPKEWNITFDEAYPYKGGNLVVEIKVLTGLTLSGFQATSWYGITQSGNNALCQDVGSWGTVGLQKFIPKTTFAYEEAVTEPYAAKVSPESLEFGKFAVGAAASTLNVTLKNKGSNSFTPSVSVSGDNFSTTYTSAEITAGTSVSIPITFDPATAGEFTGTMTINCGEAGSFTVSLSGSAVLEKTVAEGSENSAYVPVYGYYFENAQHNQMIYPSSMLESLVGKSIKSITFHPKAATNFHDGKIYVRFQEVEQDKFESASHVAVSGNALGSVIPQSGATTLTINFDKGFNYSGGNLLVDIQTEPGTYGNSYYFNAISKEGASLYQYGTNAARIYNYLPMATFGYEDSETPAPVISGTVTPTTLDFGTVTVGEDGTATITVANTGNTAFTPVFSTLEAPFSIEEATEIAAGESKEFTVTYQPTVAGENESSFDVTIGEQDPITVTLSGTATAPAVDYAVTISDNTGAHNYGNVLVNSSNVWTLTITNNGTQAVTPTLSGIEAPFSTTYTATALDAGESATISINYAPTELGEHSNTITISFPEAGDAIAAYTCVLSGKAVDESYDPSDENEVVKLVTVDKRSIYEPAFIDNANGNTTPQQLNCYDMRFKMAQSDDPTKQIKAGDLRPGNNLFEFYAIDDFGTEFRFATINLYAEGQPSSNPSVNAMDAPIKVTPSVEYYTEEGMPVHSSYSHNTTLKYTEKTYNDINELVDLEGVIDYVNDTWSANTATNSHPDHYNFQIRGVGQYGDVVTSLTAEYVKDHIGTYGLIEPEGWYRSSWVGPNNEYDDDHVYQDTYYFYDLYISKEWLDSHNITGPVTVVINTTLSGSGFNADNYKTITVNGVEQIIAKEKFKDYSWTVPLVNEPITIYDAVEGTKVIDMGIIISSISGNSDFNKTKSISIYGGGTGVSNVETVGIYKSSMNVKAYTQKQVDEDTDRNLVAMKVGNTETANADVNVLAYADPAVTGYKLNENSSASTTGMNQVATATHNENGSYTVNSVSAYNATYDFVRDESLGNIDGMWLPMYPADAQKYFLPVTIANGVGYDGVVRSEGNTYGSAMQQVEKNGSVDFGSKICHKSSYTWQENGETYAIYDPEVELTSELPAATGYELYNYRLWVDYDDNAPAWDFDLDGKHIILTDKMDRPLYTGKNTSIGGQGTNGKDEWEFIAPNDLEEVKLVARFYYKKTSTSNSPRIKARPTDSDRLYYVVEKQVTIPLTDIVTGIDNVTGKAVAGVKYYNVAGVESDRPFQGVNIEVTRYTDGSKSTRKILK